MSEAEHIAGAAAAASHLPPAFDATPIENQLAEEITAIIQVNISGGHLDKNTAVSQLDLLKQALDDEGLKSGVEAVIDSLHSTEVRIDLESDWVRQTIAMALSTKPLPHSFEDNVTVTVSFEDHSSDLLSSP